MTHATFYTLKPLIPRSVQIFFRRMLAQYKRNKYKSVWPIDPTAGAAPEGWQGWPEGKEFALVLSHDVDTQKGHDRVLDLLWLEQRLGFKSAFNFVPERYTVSKPLLRQIQAEGFEVNVHGLKHDGTLFRSKKIFDEQALRINHYLKDWKVKGFTAPSMICNLEWIHALNIDHSTSTFDTDPFEPIPNPAATIFPFTVKNPNNGHTFVELPYTLPQDHALFIILREPGIGIWTGKLDWIVRHRGMALLNSHPDYMRFDENDRGAETYPISFYMDFLKHIDTEYKGRYWNALPSEVASFWRAWHDDEPGALDEHKHAGDK